MSCKVCQWGCSGGAQHAAVHAANCPKGFVGGRTNERRYESKDSREIVKGSSMEGSSRRAVLEERERCQKVRFSAGGDGCKGERVS